MSITYYDMNDETIREIASTILKNQFTYTLCHISENEYVLSSHSPIMDLNLMLEGHVFLYYWPVENHTIETLMDEIREKVHEENERRARGIKYETLFEEK